jgi:hypothetical protein
MHIPENPDALLRRKILAEALTEAGFPTASATLASQATRGGGPPFRLYGRIPLYRWADALEWAKSRLSGPFQNTSERDFKIRHSKPASAVHEKRAAHKHER